MGKGSTRRPGDEEKIRQEYDRIFSPKPQPPSQFEFVNWTWATAGEARAILTDGNGIWPLHVRSVWNTTHRVVDILRSGRPALVCCIRCDRLWAECEEFPPECVEG